MTPTCFQCRHSMGGLIRGELYCVLLKCRCYTICERFEREPGTDEPEGDE